MWSHYADSHSGFCVGFDTAKLLKFFDSAVYQGIVTLSDEVKYHDESPEINPYHSDDTQIYSTVLFSKSSHWSYEKEYRLLCMNRTDFAIRIPPKVMVKVMLGSRCSRENEAEVIEIFKARAIKVPLFKAMFPDYGFDMSFKQIEYEKYT